MKCVRAMNGMRVFKNQNVIAYFHVVVTYNTSFLGEKCIAEKILIPIYLPGSTNLGRVVYAKESV